MSKSAAKNGEEIREATELFKQMNAPLGQFGMSTLTKASQPYMPVTDKVYRDSETVKKQASITDKFISNVTNSRCILANSLQQEILKAWGSNNSGKDWNKTYKEAQNFLSSVENKQKENLKNK